MEDKEVREFCEKMASKDAVKSLEAATKMVKSIPDRDVRTEYMNLLTEYQGAKESGEMMAVYEKVIEHVKIRYAMVYQQGFQMGMSYQGQLFQEALKRAQEEQDQEQNSEEVENDDTSGGDTE